MWQHEILTDLTAKSKYASDGRVYSITMNPNNYVSRMREPMHIGVQYATCFFMGDIGDVCSALKRDIARHEYAMLHCPYPMTLFEYESRNNLHGNKKEALLVIDTKDKLDISTLIYGEQNVKPGVSAYLWIPGMFHVDLDKKDGAMRLSGPKEDLKTHGEDLQLAAEAVVDYVIMFLRLLSCKNVEKEVVEPRTNRQIRKHKGVGLYKYYVLNVAPLSVRKKKVPASHPSEEHNRVHFQRGHFKQYTPEHPLFGMYTGLYWWEPHLRGQNKDGFVDKDYKIETAEVPA